MAGIWAVPLWQIGYVKTTLRRTSLGAGERICIWPIAHKRRVTLLPGIATLFLLISSYPDWKNSSNPALGQCQGCFCLRIIDGNFPMAIEGGGTWRNENLL